MALADFDFQPISNTTDLTNFDCEDADINAFLKEDAINYFKEKMASTYIFMDGVNVVAFFSISNNCLKDLGEANVFTRWVWDKLHKETKIPYHKRVKQYPAILIGRLGVDKKYHGTGIAYELMDFIKGWVLVGHKPACRFLILDAYNQERQIKYYVKNSFIFLLKEDIDHKTRTMYFDMMALDIE